MRALCQVIVGHEHEAEIVLPPGSEVTRLKGAKQFISVKNKGTSVTLFHSLSSPCQ